MRQQSIKLSELTRQQMKDLAGKWGEAPQKHLTVVNARCVDRVWHQEFDAMFVPGDSVYYINEHDEHIPGEVIAVKKRVKVRLDDLTGERDVWVSPSRLEIQES